MVIGNGESLKVLELLEKRETIREISNEALPVLEEIQRAIDTYFEQKRLNFPRFFFMTDTQYLEFL
jgi:hypothetical protein